MHVAPLTSGKWRAKVNLLRNTHVYVATKPGKCAVSVVRSASHIEKKSQRQKEGNGKVIEKSHWLATVPNSCFSLVSPVQLYFRSLLFALASQPSTLYKVTTHSNSQTHKKRNHLMPKREKKCHEKKYRKKDEENVVPRSGPRKIKWKKNTMSSIKSELRRGTFNKIKSFCSRTITWFEFSIVSSVLIFRCVLTYVYIRTAVCACPCLCAGCLLDRPRPRTHTHVFYLSSTLISFSTCTSNHIHRIDEAAVKPEHTLQCEFLSARDLSSSNGSQHRYKMRRKALCSSSYRILYDFLVLCLVRTSAG